jgi:hypothetical protein
MGGGGIRLCLWRLLCLGGKDGRGRTRGVPLTWRELRDDTNIDDALVIFARMLKHEARAKGQAHVMTSTFRMTAFVMEARRVR